ncbi:hypothetical protein B0T17DRAFT_207995 [Bombardia bombarda]|uniref:Uncharacterized protein n=1 Tax=Bombardia bombarda TaxID=252184 RepID=A0AA39XA90_9PEZI|nr:hypothetical protein B0T17DRAFT_207995 [Bombardia bombarda]
MTMIYSQSTWTNVETTTMFTKQQLQVRMVDNEVYHSHVPPFKEKGRRRITSFLHLPPEIRMQIYELINLQSPMRQRQLCAWYPNPAYKAHYLRAVVSPGSSPVAVIGSGKESPHDQESASTSESDSESYKGGKPLFKVASWSEHHHQQHQEPRRHRLLSPHRPIGCIPHAMLRTCRQVYLEARCIPFRENEFVFLTWFSSGLSTARAFVGSMCRWQQESMRYARLEVPAREVFCAGCVGSGSGSRQQKLEADWGELCEYWSVGLRGLRLKIDLGQEDAYSSPSSSSSSSSSPFWICEQCGWVDGGLRKLRALRSLEVELKGSRPLLTVDWKLGWCEDLRAQINDGKTEDEFVSVVCVEKTPCREENQEAMQTAGGAKDVIDG